MVPLFQYLSQPSHIEAVRMVCNQTKLSKHFISEKNKSDGWTILLFTCSLFIEQVLVIQIHHSILVKFIVIHVKVFSTFEFV